MGVHGLWNLIAPVGRRVSVETLAGKRLAIDASIWMVQFMKAMRDEKGEMVRNAHLLGFFRRICKLLFLRSKPVFVFDGGTPALKRRTVIARRRQKENAQAKVRKTAEKLLMNHIKAMRLKNLAEDLKDQRAKNDKGKEVMLNQSNSKEKNGDLSKGHNQEMIDELLVASILAEECNGFNGSSSTSTAAIGSKNGDAPASGACLTEDEDDDNDEEMILPLTNGNVDPAVLAALPPSMQLDLLSQMRERLMAENRQKYQKVKKAPQRFSELQIESYLKTVAFRREINQVQKAAAGKGVVAGVQTSRIASEANREFIFSSSFSGDKQLLASGRVEINPEEQKKIGEKDSSLDILNSIASSTKTNPVTGAIDDGLVGDSSNDVQTFLDEKGRMRVSRRRAMGIRMTRDLQRNIDLLKELEQESAPNILEKAQIIIDEEKDLSGKSHCGGQTLKVVDDFDGDTVQNNMDKSLLEANEFAPRTSSQTCINISFIDDGEVKLVDVDDELFCDLVAGNQVSVCSADNSASDCDWEEGIAGKGSGDASHENKLKENSSHAKDGNSESDVEWEEGTCVNNANKSEMKSFLVDNSEPNENTVECLKGATDICGYAPEFSTTVQKAASKGSAEEEVALQEAIRRSLDDLTGGKTGNISSALLESDYACKRSLRLESHSPEPSSKQGSVLHDIEISVSLADESGGSCAVVGKSDYTPTSASMHSRSAAAITTADGEETASPTCTANESAQIGDTCVPTHTSGADSLHATFVNDVRKNKEPASTCSSGEVSDSCTGRAASVMKEQESHTDVKSNVAKEDIFPTYSQERGNGDESSAFRDEDDFIELVDASLENELLALGQEYRNLGDEQRKLERNAASVNAEMFVECQELLQMFGLPYIIAPMEAEAQCAYMELANLVDGVVTDDSDVFLFGARSVYKNIFDDRKYVETYFMKDIESELGLNREKLIRMALLLGSDYTEGVSGIGIVNAIEVVNAFPEEDGLYKFREWVESPDPTILGKIGVQPTSKRRGSKASKRGKSDSNNDLEGTSISDCNALDENEDSQDIDDDKSVKQVFMNKHRNVSKNWHISASFPSDAVISAYTDPQVDKSTEPFAWGKPDIFLLRKVCWEKIGWASQKADELLLPVLKEYNKRETQLRLEAFYTFNERFANIRSKRVKQAVKGITGKRSSELISNDDLKRVPEKTKRRKGNIGNSKTENKEPITEGGDCIVGEMSNAAKKLKSQPKRRSSKGGLTTMTEERRLNGTGSSRVRGRQKAKSIGRGRRKDDPDSELDEPSIHVSSSSSDEHEFELPAEKAQVADNVRRSKRARRDISYVENDEESDKQTDLLTRSSKKCTNDEVPEQQLSNLQNVPKDNVPTSSRETELTSSPRDAFNRDYLAKGGGFCADEDELETVNNDGSIQNKETSFEADEDYLRMGGGFCIDDNEDEEAREDTQADGNASDQSDLPISPETAPDEIQALSEALKLNPSDKKVTKKPSVAGNTNDDNTPSSVSVFSAIPFMKRKRRKN